ncbi:endolytic transglycosylase MltG [Oceanobacillus senegalensis]|uniref:endolytic transglycosylase MltG n=1 Tax=Oceanobacillus senegalensis TaxID=1936063 RepID=UPI000A30AF72|nr:endolytic transglycosylase MltG [Oceanobacillus senegalensis]
MSKKRNKEGFKDNLIKRSKEAKKVRKIVSIIILSILVIFMISVTAGFLYIQSALKPVDPSSDENIHVEIPLGSSTSTIANILEKNGIIKNAIIYQFYIKFNNESDFQAGNYTFSPSMTLNEITQALKTGKVMEEPLYSITIPEGLNIEEIAEIYAEHLHFTKKEFIDVVNDKGYVEELVDRFPILPDVILENDEIKMPLEGYLFAATYDYYEKEPSIKSIIEKMLSQTQEVVSPYLDRIKEKELTIHEALTLASLVEKEAAKKEQRKTIAGVFYNRLEKGMRLQTDPTVAYAVGEHLETTLNKHLETESPYNTYQITGLPIGPIANFSKSSLEAVINPEETDYIFFLHDNEGNIHYAETNEEHNKNRAKYLD